MAAAPPTESQYGESTIAEPVGDAFPWLDFGLASRAISVVAAVLYLISIGLALSQTRPVPVPPPPASLPPSFMVFFDSDNTALTAQAGAVLAQVAGAYKSMSGARITITGHTDTSLEPVAAMALSLRRANAVKDGLVRQGIPAPMVSIVGRGSAGPLVQTGPGVREPQNNRVEIVLSRPSAN